ncbi:unnamed protein product [Pipistrellus nathusii]|uniref:Uncharacterized protein n=1 Tax=Pipistrellus nathusii TaxID=59473 RepID=A0ABN9ZXJ2_PIPNA
MVTHTLEICQRGKLNTLPFSKLTTLLFTDYPHSIESTREGSEVASHLKLCLLKPPLQPMEGVRQVSCPIWAMLRLAMTEAHSCQMERRWPNWSKYCCFQRTGEIWAPF